VASTKRAGSAVEEAAGAERRTPANLSFAPEPIPCEQIGPYELIFKLASGGMASVYLARSQERAPCRRVVALKRIHRHLVEEPGYRVMFLDEARLAFQIMHRNVCTVFGFGESEGEYYLTMEYLIGEPLSRVMNHVRRRQEDASRGQALRMALIIAEACAGLHVAHELKGLDGRSLEVVHRDVTPRNLFLNYDGTVKVVDFGIASARLHLHSKPTDQIRGNVAYMAPEQLVDAPTDRRADVWALGVTFWELLATRRLFKRDTPMSTVLSVIYDEIPPPSAERPQLPKALDDIVLRALQRNPERRWQSAEEMRQAIRRFLDSESEILGPADLSEWMAALFPNGEARKKELIEMALRTKPHGARQISKAKE